MKTKVKRRIIPAVIFSAVLMVIVSASIILQLIGWGFARKVPFSEQLQRLVVVHTAQSWLGTQEDSEQHRSILHIYNSHLPLAQNYAIAAEDSWCAAFGSCVAIQQRLTDMIPTECSCERQIGLWKTMGQWQEDDTYLPLPGDYIYYDWDAKPIHSDNTGWSDHVGIVVGTAGPLIKVIEGNKEDAVGYRIILRGDYRIRGFGLPDYGSARP